MTTENYNFRAKDKPTFFNHLLLESERDALVKVSDADNYDPTNLEVKLELNGVVVRVEDFNKVLEGWGERIASQIRDQLDYNNSEKAIVKKAEQLIKDKLGNIHNTLSDIEDSLWKLED